MDSEKNGLGETERERQVERLFNGVELVVGMVSVAAGGRSRYTLAAFLPFYAYFECTP